MRKMKKFLAILLASTMTLGMSMTTMAAPTKETYTSDIKVDGLVDGDANTVNVYQAIGLEEVEGEYVWVVAGWAEDYIEEDTEKHKYVITDKAGLYGAVTGDPIASKEVTGTTTTFENIPVGAYVIVASGNETVYTCLVAETYDTEATYMAAKDTTVVAKADGYKVDKVVSDGFVHVGQELDFTITTTFPNFEEYDANCTYKVTDTPTNLTINLASVKVFVGDMENALTEGYDASVSDENGALTVDLSDSIGDANLNAGKKVKVTYKATVTGTTDDDVAFANAVVATRNGEELGGDITEGYTADITITKTDDNEENATVLRGARFNVYKDNSETALKFTQLDDVTGTNNEVISVYKLDKNGEAEIEAEFGYVKVIGLDEGTYCFEETKAPLGYSINDEGVTVDITAPVDDESTKEVDESLTHVHKFGTLKDTKLIALPSTGGIGTTIFTVAGCGIMIAAAAFFFAGRKKEEN